MRTPVKTIRRVRKKYRGAFGRAPRLLVPQRFSEKLQWRKLFDHDPRFSILSDKLAVRDVIEARVGAAHLVPLLWSGTPEAIPFASLTYPCVLKSTHASQQVAMLPDRDSLREDEIIEMARGWLRVDYGTMHDEPGYCGVPPQLMVEQLVTDDVGGAPLERRLFVFDGVVRYINTVFREDGNVRNGAFHTPDWTRLDWYMSRKVTHAFPRPQRLDDMITVAERLGRDLDHVRVDVFDCDSRFYVGETTLYSWSGFVRINPDEADVLLGAHWKIPRSLQRALAAMIGWAGPAISRPVVDASEADDDPGIRPAARPSST